MPQKLIPFDPAEGLTSDEAIAAFMSEAVTSCDADYIAHALEVAARAKRKNVAASIPARSATQP